MSNTTDPELSSLITDERKPPKNFNFSEIAQPLGLFSLKSVHEFVILVGRIKPITCLVSYLVIKMWESLYKKPYETWKTVVKIFKKHKNVPTGKRDKYYFIDF